ncbi:TetR/AcrR family transcriptional regulator [Tsukamurella sp. 8F]|uniref:TetR/AcrR family transcriptional regulator n=1 Tax=unclassified Tsukamurella TaxID=2633480 RepID=UPI0023BA30E0|nr:MULTISPECIES: TetR/AcrR family transcriptional regulator [unclassified Tsukamurella]MDF0531212.1 TetR/AcrR family transcriptional regulator [Tsukamurella sp. 8J]MDF0588481.1 TetR/AcrR family transcriptional regulator [Tsukamurella sp. 8F]
MSTGVGKSSGQRRRELVIGDVLDSATDLFAVKGYDATSLQDIADAVGVSRPALYHYISSKEDLLVMLVERVSQALADVIAELSARADLQPSEKLTILTEQLVRQRAEHPSQFRILDRSEMMLPKEAGEDHAAARRRVLREVVSIIEEGIKAGQFSPVDPRTAALSLLGMCNWVAWWAKPADGVEVQAIVDTISGLAQRMLRVPETDGAVAGPAGLLAEIRTRLDRLEPLL